MYAKLVALGVIVYLNVIVGNYIIVCLFKAEIIAFWDKREHILLV